MFSLNDDRIKVSELAEVLARSIYDALNLKYDEEINMYYLKNEILNGNKKLDLLIKLCLYDLNEEIE